MASEILGKFSICPVCTGMNLVFKTLAKSGGNLPRTHGDEPTIDTHVEIVYISAPYARG